MASSHTPIHYAVCASIFQRDVLPVKPTVIYNGFAVDAYLEKRFRRKELKRLAYVGRFQPGENVELVLRLFESADSILQSIANGS